MTAAIILTTYGRKCGHKIEMLVVVNQSGKNEGLKHAASFRVAEWERRLPQRKIRYDLFNLR